MTKTGRFKLGGGAPSRSSADAEFTRRAILMMAGSTAALSAAGLTRSALAAGKFEGRPVVFASWGGAYQDAERDAYCVPFAEKTGAKVVQDGPVNVAKFRAMVEAGDPIWDVIDVTDGMLYNV